MTKSEIREAIAKLAAKARKRRKRPEKKQFSCAFCASSRPFWMFAIEGRSQNSASDFGLLSGFGPSGFGFKRVLTAYAA
jgi:hypothetical protein